jgi:hypothetical protein
VKEQKMNIARRVYLYLVAFISLQMLLAGASNLLRLGGEALLGSNHFFSGATYYRDQLSLWGAILVVGALVWAVHWLLAQRGATGADAQALDERHAVLRKLFLYAVLFVALWQVFFATSELLRQLLLSIFSSAGALRDAVSAQLPVVIVYGLGWFYYWTVRQGDERIAPEVGRAATVRRWYVYLVCFGTLSVGMWAGGEVARGLWRLLTVSSAQAVGGTSALTMNIAGAMSWLLVSVACWAAHWVPTQRLVAHSAEEQGSALRKVYLYGLIFQTVAVTLVNLALFLYKLLQLLLGGDTSAGITAGESLLTAAGIPLLAAAVYGLFWAYHGQVVAGDARLVAEQPRQATIRRVYQSVVALVGLAVLAGGLADVTRLLLDLWLGGRDTTILSRAGWADQISLFTTLILVGAPVWTFQWLRLQRRALAIDGGAERDSLVRRIYLLLILFFSVTGLLGGLATLLYQVFRYLGTTFSGAAITIVSWATGVTIAAIVFLAYHLRVLIADQRHRAARPITAPAAAGEAGALTGYVILVRGGTDATMLPVLNALKTQLPSASDVQGFVTDDVKLTALRDRLTADSYTELPLQQDPTPVGTVVIQPAPA